MIPVNEGRINPPKKRRNQTNDPTTANESKNGTGKAHATANKPAILSNLNDFRVLYPPNEVVIIPPTTTPLTGAVKQVAVK